MSDITLLIGFSVLYLSSLIIAKLRINELYRAYENLLLINDNLFKTVPDLDKLISLTARQADKDKIKLFKVHRKIGAPDITEGEVYEVIIAAKNETEVFHMLSKVRGFVDDGWWSISTVEQVTIVKISYLKTL